MPLRQFQAGFTNQVAVLIHVQILKQPLNNIIHFERRILVRVHGGKLKRIVSTFLERVL